MPNWRIVRFEDAANIVLNGLGIVLSPKGSPGFLPGLSAGAFSPGTGLSFALLYAVKTAALPSVPTSPADRTAGMIAGVVDLAAAIATSLTACGCSRSAPDRSPARSQNARQPGLVSHLGMR
ncbi:hypothetical protein [Streptomyces triticisoli]|uniref:hypothetical protein n=1 Tax=Streptomyces triticisoli TaxID=2182797 RepID=UPI003F69BC54